MRESALGADDTDATEKAKADEYVRLKTEEVKSKFDAAANASGRVALREVHQIIFTADERAEYSLRDFETDLLATAPRTLDELAWDEVLAFLRDNA